MSVIYAAGLTVIDFARFISSKRKIRTWHHWFYHENRFNNIFAFKYKTELGDWLIAEMNNQHIVARGTKCLQCGHVDTRQVFIQDSQNKFPLREKRTVMAVHRPWINIEPNQLCDPEKGEIMLESVTIIRLQKRD